MASRKRTISDVARQAGVSVATVSRALNGGKISSGSLRRVQAAIRALGYQRNTLARSLVTGKSEVVGVLVPDVLGPLYAQIARGIEDVLIPLGMQYTLVTSAARPLPLSLRRAGHRRRLHLGVFARPAERQRQRARPRVRPAAGRSELFKRALL